jgi:hypothetical protein
MYNTLSRAQNTFGFFTTVAFFLGAFIAVSDLLTLREPSVSLIKTDAIQVYDSNHSTSICLPCLLLCLSAAS